MTGGIEQLSIGEEMVRLAALITEHDLTLEVKRARESRDWLGKVHGTRPRTWRVVAKNADLDFMLSHLRQAVQAAIAHGISPETQGEGAEAEGERR
ncbi:MAG TPA: hypothetical protein VGD39_12295 [Nocardioides sp.]